MARILLVDDDRDVLEVARRALESRGHAVNAQATAGAGLEAARAERFDVVLLDIELPDRSGLLVVREMAAAAACPVILMTGHADSEVQRDALALGAAGLLAKPFDLAGLIERVEGCLE